MDKQKLIHQLFIGKVADEIGIEKTTSLLKEANEAFAIPVVSRSNAMDTKKGLKLALDYISKTPCDPDITDEQIKSWIKLQDFVNKHID